VKENEKVKENREKNKGGSDREEVGERRKMEAIPPP
jgi:hypothetical protein